MATVGHVATDEHPDQRDEDRRDRFEDLAREVMEPLRRFLARRTDPATADDVLGRLPARVLAAARRRARRTRCRGPTAWPGTASPTPNARSVGSSGSRQRSRWSIGPSRRAYDAGERDGQLEAAMATLRPQDAELLRLWAWEQLTPTEIATVLEITSNAASIRLHRARERLRVALRKVDAGSGHEQSREGRKP